MKEFVSVSSATGDKLEFDGIHPEFESVRFAEERLADGDLSPEEQFNIFWHSDKLRNDFYNENFADPEEREMAKASDTLNFMADGSYTPTTLDEMEEAVRYGEMMMRGSPRITKDNSFVSLAPNAEEQGIEAKYNHLLQYVSKMRQRKVDFVTALQTDDLYNLSKELDSPTVDGHKSGQDILNNLIYLAGKNFNDTWIGDDGRVVHNSKVALIDPETLYGHAFHNDSIWSNAANAYTGGTNRDAINLESLASSSMLPNAITRVAPSAHIASGNQLPEGVKVATHPIVGTDNNKAEYAYFYSENEEGGKTFFLPVVGDWAYAENESALTSTEASLEALNKAFEKGEISEEEFKNIQATPSRVHTASNGRVTTDQFLVIDEREISHLARQQEFNNKLFYDEKNKVARDTMIAHMASTFSPLQSKVYNALNKMQGDDKIFNHANDTIAEDWAKLTDDERNQLSVIASIRRAQEYGGSGGFWATAWDSFCRAPGNSLRGITRGTSKLYDFCTESAKDNARLSMAKSQINALLDESVVYDKNTGMTYFGSNVGQAAESSLEFMAMAGATKGVAKGVTYASSKIASTQTATRIAKYLNATNTLAKGAKTGAKVTAATVKTALSHAPAASLYALRNIEDRMSQAALMTDDQNKLAEEYGGLLAVAAAEGVAVDYALERLSSVKGLEIMGESAAAFKMGLMNSIKDGTYRSFISAASKNFIRRMGNSYASEVTEEMIAALVGTPINCIINDWYEYRLLNGTDEGFEIDWNNLVNETTRASVDALTSTLAVSAITEVGSSGAQTAQAMRWRARAMDIKRATDAENGLTQAFRTLRETNNVHRPAYMEAFEADVRNAEKTLASSYGRALTDAEKAETRNSVAENAARRDMEFAYNKWRSFDNETERKDYLVSLGFSENQITDIESAFYEVFEYRGGVGYVGMMSDDELGVREVIRGFGIDDSAYSVDISDDGSITLDFTSGKGEGTKLTFQENIYTPLESIRQSGDAIAKAWLDKALRVINGHHSTTKEDIRKIVSDLGFAEILSNTTRRDTMLNELIQNPQFMQAMDDALRQSEGLFVESTASTEAVEGSGVLNPDGTDAKTGSRRIIIKRGALEGTTETFGHEFGHDIWEAANTLSLLDDETRRAIEEQFSTTNEDGTKTFNEEAFARAFGKVLLARLGTSANNRIDAYHYNKRLRSRLFGLKKDASGNLVREDSPVDYSGLTGKVRLGLESIAFFFRNLFGISQSIASVREEGGLKSVQDIMKAFLESAKALEENAKGVAPASEGGVKTSTPRNYNANMKGFVTTDVGAKVAAGILDYITEDETRIQSLFGRKETHQSVSTPQETAQATAQELTNLVLRASDKYDLNDEQIRSIIVAIYESMMRSSFSYKDKDSNGKTVTKRTTLDQAYASDIELPQTPALKRMVAEGLKIVISRRKGGRFDNTHSVAIGVVNSAYIAARQKMRDADKALLDSAQKEIDKLRMLNARVQSWLDAGSISKEDLDEANKEVERLKKTIEGKDKTIKEKNKTIAKQREMLGATYLINLENEAYALREEIDSLKASIQESAQRKKEENSRAKQSLEGANKKFDKARAEREDTARMQKAIREERQHIEDALHAREAALLAAKDAEINAILESLAAAADVVQSRIEQETQAQIAGLQAIIDALTEEQAKDQDAIEGLAEEIDALDKALARAEADEEYWKNRKIKADEVNREKVKAVREELRIAKKDLWKKKNELRSALAIANKFQPKYEAEHAKRMLEQKEKTKFKNEAKALRDKLIKRDARIKALVERVEKVYKRGIDMRKKEQGKQKELREKALERLTDSYELKIAKLIVRHTMQIQDERLKHSEGLKYVTQTLSEKHKEEIARLIAKVSAEKARKRAMENEKGISASSLSERYGFDVRKRLMHLIGWSDAQWLKYSDDKRKGVDHKAFTEEEGSDLDRVSKFLDELEAAHELYILEERPDLASMGYYETKKSKTTGELMQTDIPTQRMKAYTGMISSILHRLEHLLPYGRKRASIATMADKAHGCRKETARAMLANALLDTMDELRRKQNLITQDMCIGVIDAVIANGKKILKEGRENRNWSDQYFHGASRILHRLKKALTISSEVVTKTGKSKLTERLEFLEKRLQLSEDAKAAAESDTDFAVSSEMVEETREVEVERNGKKEKELVTEKVSITEQRHYDIIEFHFLSRYGGLLEMPATEAWALANEAADWIADYVNNRIGKFIQWRDSCAKLSEQYIDGDAITNAAQMHREGLGWLALFVPDFFEKLRWNASANGVDVVNKMERLFSSAARLEDFSNKEDMSLIHGLCANAYGLDADTTDSAKIETIGAQKWESLREDVKPDYEFFSNPQRKGTESVINFKNHLSRANLIYIYAALRQTDVREKFKKNYEHYADPAKPDVDGIDVYYSRLEEVLTAEDIQLADNIVKFFADKRTMLSNRAMQIFGVPVFAPVEDYIPLIVNSDKDMTSTNYSSFTMYPSFLKQRVFHERGLDETSDLFDVAWGRARQINRWNAYVDLYRTMHEVFGDPKVNLILTKRIGKRNMRALNKQFKDIFNGIKFGSTAGERVVATGAATISLAWNLKSATRQLEGIAATKQAAVELGLQNRGIGLFSLLGSKQGREAIARELGGEIIRNRIEGGNSLEMRQALNNLRNYILTTGESHPRRRGFYKLLQKFVNASFSPLKLADALSCAMMIASLRPRLEAKWKSERGIEGRTNPDGTMQTVEEIVESELDIAVQKYQQSGRPEYLNSLQRSESAIVRLMSMFIGPAAMTAGAQVKTVHDIISGYRTGDKQLRKTAWARLRAIFVRALAFSLINEMLSFLFGDDEEELDDVAIRFGLNLAFGTVSGLPIIGGVISTATYHLAKLLTDDPNARTSSIWDKSLDSILKIPAVGAWKRFGESTAGVFTGGYQLLAEGGDYGEDEELVREEAFGELLEDIDTMTTIPLSDAYKLWRNWAGAGKFTEEEKKSIKSAKGRKTRAENKKE